MWELYDAIIAAIPEGKRAEDILIGTSFAAVRCGDAVGLGSYHQANYYTRPATHPGSLAGMTLRELAPLIKSWNALEAAIGHAAINAYYNAPEVAAANGLEIDPGRREDRMHDPFIMSQKEVRGKRVVTVGHFPYLEQLFQPICELSIIEWEPDVMGDYPMQAAEYLLPQCDFAYLNASGLPDKTLPRMLSLAAGAQKITLVGPTATLWPGFAGYGVQDISGFLITDPERAMRIVRGTEQLRIFSCGKKVSMKP